MRERNEHEEDWRRWAEQAERDKEKSRVVDEIALNFEKGLLSVIAGKESRADLYSGDFVYKESSLELILVNSGSNILTAEYYDLCERFLELVEPYLLDDDFITESIRREPEPRTDNLRNFLTYHKGKALVDLQSSRKLRSEDSKKILLLSVDRYIKPQTSRIPLSETWTLRKMKLDTDGSVDLGFYSRYTVKPRSMVSTQSLPALPSGEKTK